MNRFVLKNTFIKIYIHHFSINIFYKNKKSKLHFGDRVAVRTTFFLRTRREYLASSSALFVSVWDLLVHCKLTEGDAGALSHHMHDGRDRRSK